MRGILFVLLLTLVFNLGSICNSFAEEEKKAEDITEVTEIKEASTEETTVEVKKDDTKTASVDCECEKPAIEVLSKAYISLEEDEWPAAIKACTDAETKITELEKTCKCPSIPIYKKVAKAYSNYAKGGNILDGEEDIDCLKATKLYEEAEKLFEESLSKILDEKLKKEASLISDFCVEENEFVKEECSS
ncbi:MAG: hypothetical protein HYR97_07450 [Candidatus Melainabacteria bacterium]|nr:hypothetical protein [Candidatus Melainabacteria bacterium]